MPLVTFDDRNIECDIEGGTHEVRIGNTLIQWGQQLASNSATTTVTFSKTFSSTPYMYFSIAGVTRTLDVRTAQLVSATNSTFTFFVTGAQGGSNYYSGTYVNWLAIGTV